MNQKNSSFLYGILAVIVLLVFLLILYFLGRENSQPATINDKVTGFYSSAPINNRCTIAQITEPTTLLPGFNSPQNCGENYTCVQNGTPDNPFGYCKVPITESTELTKIYSCNTVYDCAPYSNPNEIDPNEIVYCNGTCQTTTFSNWNSKSPKTYGGLYSYCDFNTPCDNDNNLICSNVLNNFSSPYGECLIKDGGFLFCENGFEQGCCTSDEQCLGGKCDFNRGEKNYGLCISRIDPAKFCDINYCDSGFGCDFSQTDINPANNLCQPLLTSGPAQYGKINSFCSYDLGMMDQIKCDAGLVCNIDISINGTKNYPTSLYPSLLGIGQCALPKNALKDSCSASGGCIEPLVCNNGTCEIPGYLYNIGSASQTPDVNYCGPEYTSVSTNYPVNGSSGACLNGYTCVNTGMSILSDSDFCVGVPESTTAIGLCNSSTSDSYGNFCGTTGGGTGCTGRYIGVFLQGYSYLGVWRFITLPDQTVTANNVNGNSKISVYQTVPTSEPNITYPITKIIFFPNVNSGDNFFFYAEFSTYNIDPSGENKLKHSPDWYKINVSMSSNQGQLINLLDIKFTPAGNFALFVEETMPINFPFTPGSLTGGSPENYKRIYWEPSTTLAINPSAGGTLIYTTSQYGPMFCNPSTTPTSSNPGDFNSIFDPSSLGIMYFNDTLTYYNPDTFVWDVDDLYNNSIVVGFIENLLTGYTPPSSPSRFIFFSSTVTNTGGNFALNNVTTLGTTTPINISGGYPNYVKYYTDFSVAPSEYANFLYNYSTFGQNKLIYNLNSYFDIELENPLSFALSFSKYGTINNFIYYYMSADGEIRSVLAKKGETQPTESNVYGYAPKEIVNNTTSDALMLGFTSMGNIDNSLYALVQTCSPSP
jgi:hypothetical protein